MFLRHIKRKKNGKEHRYFSVVENRRLADGRTQQRQVVYLGEINDSQQAAWRKSLEVFDEDRGGYRELSLFPDDRLLPPDAVDALSVKLSEMQLRHPRAFGDCWLGCRLWEELGLGRFWAERLAKHEGDVPWEKVLQVLAVNRLCDPASEFRVHRQWFGDTAMDELLGVGEAAAGKDRLYRCLDLLTEHKDELCRLPRRAVEDAVRRQLRRAAVRPDQHLLRGRVRADPHGQPRLQPRRAGRLPAGGRRPGGDARRAAAGVRGAGGQHVGQDHAQGVPGQGRGPVRQGAAGVGDGPRHPHRGDAEADARGRRGVPGGHAAVAAAQAGAGAAGAAVAAGARGDEGEAAEPRGGDLRAGPQRAAGEEGAGDAAAAVQGAGPRPARPAQASCPSGTRCSSAWPCCGARRGRRRS